MKHPTPPPDAAKLAARAAAMGLPADAARDARLAAWLAAGGEDAAQKDASPAPAGSVRAGSKSLPTRRAGDASGDDGGGGCSTTADQGPEGKR